MENRRPLLISENSELIDEILRLAAATGVDVHLAAHAESARAQWAHAPIVLIGTDRLGDVSRLPRRRDVIVITRDVLPDDQSSTGGGRRPVPDAVWREAIAIGAEHVITLPDAERWLIDRLADSGDGPSRQGEVICVVGACGGAGASTTASVMASISVAQGKRTLLIDTDETGGGLDLALGAEMVSGARWADISDARGRISPLTLDEALPHPGGVALLSFGRLPSEPLLCESLACILDAGVRGYDTIIVDQKRVMDSVSALALGKATTAFVVIPNRLRAVAAAAALLPGLDYAGTPTLLLRKATRGLAVSDVERAIGHLIDFSLPEDPTIALDGELGELPSPRSEYGQVCTRALAHGTPVVAAA